MKAKSIEKTDTVMAEQHRVLHDTAITQPEQDALRRTDFARHLADSIANIDVSEGFVFALNGLWGSGKTSILNLVRHHLAEASKAEQSHPVLVLQFNPWWFSGREELIQTFLRQFRTLLRQSDVPNVLSSAAEVIDDFAAAISPATALLSAGADFEPSWFLSRSLASAARSIGKRLAADIHGLKEKVETHLRKFDGRIVVIVDDIDRLPIEEVQQVFQLAKAVCNFPRTVYLLAFDHQHVARALEEGSFAVNGSDYIEKIVQVPLSVPAPDKVLLRRMLFDELNLVVARTPEGLFDQTEWGNVFWDGIDHFIQTPRHIKRVSNMLHATYPLVSGEVHAVDFIVVQALRVFAPNLHEFIASHQDLFAGQPDTTQYGRHSGMTAEAKKEHRDMVLQLAPAEHRDAVDALLKRISPMWEFYAGGQFFHCSATPDDRRRCRFCCPEVFSRYFMLGVPCSDMSAVEMESLVKTAEKQETFEQTLLALADESMPDGRSRLRLFLERIQDYTDDFPEARILPVLRAIHNVGDKLILEQDEDGFFGFANDMMLLRIAYQLLRRKTQDDRFRLLKAAMESGEAPFMIAHQVATLGQEHGKFTSREQLKPEAEREVTAQHLKELEGIALVKIRKAAADGSLANSPCFLRTMFAWEEWAGPEEPCKYIADLVATDSGLCLFLSCLLTRIRSHGMTDRVTKTKWRVPLKNLEHFLSTPRGTLAERAAALLNAENLGLSDKDKLALRTFTDEVKNPKGDFD